MRFEEIYEEFAILPYEQGYFNLSNKAQGAE